MRVWMMASLSVLLGAMVATAGCDADGFQDDDVSDGSEVFDEVSTDGQGGTRAWVSPHLAPAPSARVGPRASAAPVVAPLGPVEPVAVVLSPAAKSAVIAPRPEVPVVAEETLTLAEPAPVAVEPATTPDVRVGSEEADAAVAKRLEGHWLGVFDGGSLIVREDVDASWLRGPARWLDHDRDAGVFDTRRSLDRAALSGPLAQWRGAEIVAYSAAGERCEGRVRSLEAQSRVHHETYHGPKPRHTAAEAFELGDRVIAARISWRGRCVEPLLAHLASDAELAAQVFVPRKAESWERQEVMSAFRWSAEWAQRQATYETQLREESGGPQAGFGYARMWDENQGGKPAVGEFTHGGRTIVLVGQGTTGQCGDMGADQLGFVFEREGQRDGDTPWATRLGSWSPDDLDGLPGVLVYIPALDLWLGRTTRGDYASWFGIGNDASLTVPFADHSEFECPC